jgi:hypothetical protein
MSSKAKTKRQRKTKGLIKRKVKRKGKAQRKGHRKRRGAKRSAHRRRKVASTRKTPKRVRNRLPSRDPLIEVAVLEMNRGQSLTAAARDSQIPHKQLKGYLEQQRLFKRKGQRRVVKDNRPRRVPVMTKGRIRVLTVRGYEQARLVGEHHNAAGEFVRTNDIALIKPFNGQNVETAGGRKYFLETDPNALHRIAAMDTPPFHEIYEITSAT